MNLALVGSEDHRINQEALEEWQAYRAEDLKKPMTPRAIKMLTKKLMQWSPQEQERLIEHAMEMNWKGVYWVEPPKAPRQASSRDRSIQQDLTDTSWAYS